MTTVGELIEELSRFDRHAYVEIEVDINTARSPPRRRDASFSG